MKKFPVNSVIKILLAIVLMVLLFSSLKVDYKQILRVLYEADPLYLVLSLPGVIVVLLVKSFRWNRLLKITGISFSYVKSFSAYMSGYAIGILTPGRIGEFVKVYFVRQEKNTGFLEAFESVLADRLFDFVCLIMLGMAAFVSLKFSLGMATGILVYIGFQLVAIAGLFVVYKLSDGIIRRFAFLQKPLVYMLKNCLVHLTSLKSIPLWISTWISYLMYFVFLRFLLMAFGIEISFIGIMNSMSLLSLVLLVPLTLAGFGQREVSLVYLLGLYGVQAEIAVAFSLMQFTMFFLWGGLAGLVFLLLNPMPVSVIREDARSIKNFFKKSTKDSSGTPGSTGN